MKGCRIKHLANNFLALVLIALAIGSIFFGDRLFDWATGTPRGDKLLFSAAASGDSEGIDRALRQGANINARSDSSLTPLMVASDSHHPETVRMLIRRGADPNARANAGISSLYNAVVADDPEVIAILIDAGAVTNELNFGETILDVAHRLNARNAASALRQRGAKHATEIP